MADRGFTCEPCYTRNRSAERTLRCIEGEVFVVVADMRLGSPTLGHWQGIYLTEDDLRTLSVPSGVACGWQVSSSRGRLEHRFSRWVSSRRWRWLRWDDRFFDIAWPDTPTGLLHHARRSRQFQSLPDSQLPRYVSAGAKPMSPKLSQPKLPKRSSVPAPGQRPVDCAPTTRPSRSTRLAKDNLLLVIGSSGQLGRDLCRHLRKLGSVVGACRNPDRGSLLPVPLDVDISRPASLRQAIRTVKPTLIINAAGITDVHQAEAEPRIAQLVNATAPAVMADEARRLDAALIHFCSDTVFGGQGERPWRESDVPQPENQLARTKLLGTEAIRSSGIPHLILRAGWLYSSHGNNYVRQLMDLLSYRNSVSLSSDHYGSPTSTDWLAQTLTQIISQAQTTPIQDWLVNHGGLYHAATLGYASRIEVGDQIMATCRQYAMPIVLNKLEGRPLSEPGAKIRLSRNCRLDATRLATTFNIEIPRWQEELNRQIGLMLNSIALPQRAVA